MIYVSLTVIVLTTSLLIMHSKERERCRGKIWRSRHKLPRRWSRLCVLTRAREPTFHDDTHLRKTISSRLFVSRYRLQSRLSFTTRHLTFRLALRFSFRGSQGVRGRKRISSCQANIRCSDVNGESEDNRRWAFYFQTIKNEHF